MSRSISGANAIPTTANGMDTPTPARIACQAVADAASGFFSPMRRATMAVTAILRPIPVANTKISNEAPRPTAATASAPSRLTKKISANSNTDCINISRTIGMDRSATARTRLPDVKSCCVPRMDSRMARAQLPDCSGGRARGDGGCDERDKQAPLWCLY